MLTDMQGNDITSFRNPAKIACLHCVSPDRVLTLGEGARIRLMAEPSPWTRRLYPELAAENREGITPEQMLDMNIDLVFFSPGMDNGALYKDAGLNTVCSFSDEHMPGTVDEFIENFTQQVTLFGELLGGAAVEKAAAYNKYFEKKTRAVYTVTSAIPEKERPAVYYGGKADNMLHTQGRNSFMHWNAVIAGCDYLPGRLTGNYAVADMKQVLEWDPGFIFINGYIGSVDIVTSAPEWADVSAVKNGRVYRIPRTVLAWDHASRESILLMIYIAKIIHPEKFASWNMEDEVVSFYKEACGKEISHEDAGRILNCLPPL